MWLINTYTTRTLIYLLISTVWKSRLQNYFADEYKTASRPTGEVVKPVGYEPAGDALCQEFF